jgi:hypothetical protein
MAIRSLPSNRRNDNDERTEKGLSVRPELQLQHRQDRRLQVQSVHLQALQLLSTKLLRGEPPETSRGGALHLMQTR